VKHGKPGEGDAPEKGRNPGTQFNPSFTQFMRVISQSVREKLKERLKGLNLL
jgi:hypothetical protein